MQEENGCSMYYIYPRKKTRYSSVKMKIFLNIRKTPGRDPVAGGTQEGRFCQLCDHFSKIGETVIKVIWGKHP